jgi:hypothetical protein
MKVIIPLPKELNLIDLGQSRLIYTILSFHILIARLIMHDQLVVNKIKAVAHRLKWICDHLLYNIIIEGWDVIDRVPAIHAPRNAKAKQEVVAFDELVLEVVALNHPKVGYHFVPNFECKAKISIH